MRNTTPTQSIEKLLRALFEGTASDGPWVEHNGIAWEMEELAYHEPLDMVVPYQYLLLTLASDQTRAATHGNMGVAWVIPTFVGIGVW